MGQSEVISNVSKICVCVCVGFHASRVQSEFILTGTLRGIWCEMKKAIVYAFLKLLLSASTMTDDDQEQLHSADFDSVLLLETPTKEQRTLLPHCGCFSLGMQENAACVLPLKRVTLHDLLAAVDTRNTRHKAKVISVGCFC